MIKENIILEKKYFDLSSKLIEELEKTSLMKKKKLVIGICGESGSGKSVTAKCLQILLEKQGINAVILHQDSYFIFPPKENHEKRKLDLSWVGPNEVEMDLMQTHIEQFKSHKERITTRVVDYEKNVFLQQDSVFKNKSVLIVEGVYTFLLKELDYKIFIERSYKDTLEKRKERKREVYDPFVERVLAIEHAIVSPLRKLANVKVTKNYAIKNKST